MREDDDEEGCEYRCGEEGGGEAGFGVKGGGGLSHFWFVDCERPRL